ncbi:alkaline phosphatase family protein [Halorussus lipolyticus]|uniref:alkaline phosphatase family protein n=1 Tax=Halorussus lipolyticus TaxID=3034024 RepID=UPI0023E85C1B|nr:alkaline phosphatase family protein [Halorussus sp. DT80]
MTLVVLAIDALDPVHVDTFEADEFRLSTWGECETFAHMYDKPHTSEVWPTVATGKHPSEHGVTEESTSEWDNPLVDFASRFTGRLSGRHRALLGKIAQRATGADWELKEVESDTVFDGPGRVVHNWPGVHRGSELQRAWEVFQQANQSEMSTQEFDRRIRGIASEQFGWVREMLNHDLNLVASHVHVIDATGHVYRNDRERYHDAYEWTIERLEEVKSAMGPDDELLLVSDHGIETAWIDGDDNPGGHSWRAFTATTLDTRPESVFEVREWVEAHVEDTTAEEDDLDIPEEQLEDLGYI